MVDPIEVKLDEVEEHVLKTQADVDRLMRDFAKPDKAKDILRGMPGGGGGMFDQIIKAITEQLPESIQVGDCRRDGSGGYHGARVYHWRCNQ